MLYETHSHTPLCKHAVGEPDEYAAQAVEKGLSGYTISCHNPMPDDFAAHVRMSIDEFSEYLSLVERTRQAWDGRLDVLLGIECDYFPGYESWLEEQIASAPFDYVIGSVHPQLREIQERYYHGDAREFQANYFRLLAEAAETGLFDCISHPDLIKLVTPCDWVPAAIMDEIREALDRIAGTGTAMELNTSGAIKRIPEMNPFPEMLREMVAREIPIVIGADAHLPHRVGDRFEEALDLLAECGYEHVNYYKARERIELAIPAARASLKDTREF